MAIGDACDLEAGLAEALEDRVAHLGAIALGVAADLLVHEDVDVLVGRRDPPVGIDTDRPGVNLVAPVHGEHLALPLARHHDAENVVLGEEIGRVDRMVVHRRTEDDRGLGAEPVEQMRLAEDASDFVGMRSKMAIVVDPIGSADLVEPCHQIQENALQAKNASRPANETANDGAWIAVERQPAITVRAVMIEEIERLCARQRSQVYASLETHAVLRTILAGSLRWQGK